MCREGLLIMEQEIDEVIVSENMHGKGTRKWNKNAENSYSCL